MNTSENFTEKKSQLLELLKIGMPIAIIMAYFKISKSACISYVKKLREGGKWDQENVTFLKSIKNVTKTFRIVKDRQVNIGEIECQRLQISIEEVLSFKRIVEILMISINSANLLTLLEFSPEVQKGYRDLIKIILLRGNECNLIGPDEAKSIFFDYLYKEEDFQIGQTVDTWFHPMIHDIISKKVRGLRNSINPIFEVDVMKRVDYILSVLTLREAEILRKYFGIGCEKLSLDQIAIETGLTRERTRQIREKALRRCKKRKGFLFNYVSLPVIQPVPETITPIESIDFSIRALNVLKAADIKTIEELARFKREDFLKFRNIGKKSMDEIEEVLKKHNLKLQQPF